MALRVHPTSLTRAVLLPYHCSRSSLSNIPHFQTLGLKRRSFRSRRLKALPRRSRSPTITAALPPLDLTEDNIRQVLIDARSELAQIFDSSVGITGMQKTKRKKKERKGAVTWTLSNYWAAIPIKIVTTIHLYHCNLDTDHE
uniref:Uncharacterized protein LOC105050026 isoform X2 n=1 Tax=Elaeis guineensis var. tenera TaxID=51953 RepID=A0A6I9RKN8_ELAGV|nr:uncharacterized protein LOC105050026 isoform X2 [Elaeis guineensis]